MKPNTILLGYFDGLTRIVIEKGKGPKANYLRTKPADAISITRITPNKKRTETFFLARQFGKSKEWKLYIFDFQIAKGLTFEARKEQRSFVEKILYTNLHGEAFEHKFDRPPEIKPVTKKPGNEVSIISGPINVDIVHGITG